MDIFTKIFRVAPLPDTDGEKFEAFFREQVLPAVDTGQTRAGRITASTFHQEPGSDRVDRYVWLVTYDGVNADWVDTNLTAAIEKLKTVALPVSSTVFKRLG